MPRTLITLEYDGAPFSGWQAQADQLTVQGVLEKAAFALTGEQVSFQGAGRTDKGVHARGQKAHVDFQGDYSLDRIRRGLNAHLKEWPVIVLEAIHVPDTFHARFDALARTYEYTLLNRPSPAVLDQARAFWIPKPLDMDLMHKGAALFVGHHDFSAFRAACCQGRSPWKTLELFEFFPRGDTLVARIRSRSFLHHQVRMMMGSLCYVGLGLRPLSWLEDLLRNAHEGAKGVTAPAQALCLTQVDYPPARLLG